MKIPEFSFSEKLRTVQIIHEKSNFFCMPIKFNLFISIYIPLAWRKTMNSYQLLWGYLTSK